MTAKKKGKTSKKTSVEVGLVRQPHGGALSPGNPGNKGNRNATGREPEHSHIRTHCRVSFAERIPILEAIADGVPLTFTKTVKDEDGEIVTVTGEISASVRERVSAIETLGKYGGVDKLALTPEEQPERGNTREQMKRDWVKLKRIVSIEEFEEMLTKPKQLGDGE